MNVKPIIVSTLATVIAIAGGLWLAEQVRDPYSDFRLWLAGVVDTVNERGKS